MDLKPNSPFVLAKASNIALGNDDVARARSLAEAALKISANDPAALSALNDVLFVLHDWAAGTKVTERLLTLEPLSMYAMGSYWRYLNHADRYEEAREIALRALALYPDAAAPLANTWLAMSNANLGDKLGAIEAGRKGMPYGYPYDLWAGLDFDWNFTPLNPLRSIGPLAYVGQYDKARQIIIDEYTRLSDSPATRDSVEYLIHRGVLETLAGNLHQSIEFFEQARAQSPDKDNHLFWSNTYSWLAPVRQSSPALALLHAYRQTGQDEKANAIAVEISDEIAADIQSHQSVGGHAEQEFLYIDAQIHAIEGRTSEAIAALRIWAATRKFPFNYVKTDPFLQNLHGMPEFHALVAEVEAELATLRAKYHAKMAKQSAADT
jgi:tetratricopeptide (TPR) repeat protein